MEGEILQQISAETFFDWCLEWLDNNPPEPDKWEKFSNHFKIELLTFAEVQSLLLQLNYSTGNLYLMYQFSLYNLAEEMLFIVLRAFSSNEQYPMIQAELARRQQSIYY